MYIIVFNTTIKHFPILMSSLINLKEKGNSYFAAGSYKEAINCYSEAINKFGIDAVILSNRAQCWIKLSNWQKAREDAELGLMQNCASRLRVKLLFRKGLALRALGKELEAEDSFQQVLKLEPGNKDAASALVQPPSKKAKACSEVVVPLEVVDSLPLEFAAIVRDAE